MADKIAFRGQFHKTSWEDTAFRDLSDDDDDQFDLQARLKDHGSENDSCDSLHDSSTSALHCGDDKDFEAECADHEEERRPEIEDSERRLKRKYFEICFEDDNEIHIHPPSNNTVLFQSALEALERSQMKKVQALEQQAQQQAQLQEQLQAQQQNLLLDLLDKSEEMMFELVLAALREEGLANGLDTSEEEMIKTNRVEMSPAQSERPAKRPKISNARRDAAADQSTAELWKWMHDEALEEIEAYKASAYESEMKCKSAENELEKLRHLHFLSNYLGSSSEPSDGMKYLDLECFTQAKNLEHVDYYEVQLLIQNEELEQAWNKACSKKMRELLKCRGRK